MTESAIGLIETKGLVGVLEAADTAAKAAHVHMLGVERIGGGLVSVRFRGDTASVQAAVSAGAEAARRLSPVVNAHVIPSPAIDLGHVVSEKKSPSPAASHPEQPPPVEDLHSLPVTRLRQLARRTPGLSLQGRQISRANKQQLIEALSAVAHAASARRD